MASRRDELNAYTFAKRRLLAAFLQPSPSGTEEGAPKPLRTVVPSLVAGALTLAVFGAWGMFQPTAPSGWDEPGARVIVGKQSTTRYVVLKTDGDTRLHPVLNLASARLLMKDGTYEVVQVGDDVLDSGEIPRGPILGIPYAPDRLPAPEEAGRAKRWAVCEQPGGKGETVQEATFVLASQEAAKTEGAGRLKGGDTLYVATRTGERYLVDAEGSFYHVTGTESDALTTALVGSRKPQLVTNEWLATLHQGDPIRFPPLPPAIGTPAGVSGALSAQENKVGTVLKTETGEGTKYYVVLPGKVQPITEFTAWLLITSPQTATLNMNGEARTVGLQDFTAEPDPFEGQPDDWPRQRVHQVNSASAGTGRDTVCSVLRKVDTEGDTTLSTWAGQQYPAEITSDGTSTHVTPGTGLLYTQIQGTGTDSGSLFLVTDTGLRYAVQANGDSDADRSDIGADGRKKTSDGSPEPSEAQVKLGYENVRPAKVPLAWSEFLAKGPRLDTNSARQPQGS
ncbi:type VII secretion protein EccB [Streptomyces anthocyanicus]|uniref:type VII secretion protein EccB n=1 Tax=Streptomyces TaxID=1883 RepID=UPI00087D3864|nr:MULTISPECIES: type VII secretion protein EccB [Streptomyces]MDX3322524.1 type VII secretion protein EccB [Streptomyces sp. ME03-5684b]REH23920.1 type VII secretion protein EccB [Streptomyces sp. 2221.1]WTC48228.1 type VII secretion protein EccB [Streptomyces anthocyanicus]SDT76298.1 type VII secretion protein EccB [Streptomyces sp. 2114.2]GHA71360.1 type VII secretion protein EccB [Streptomyces anthocyanicus]